MRMAAFSSNAALDLVRWRRAAPHRGDLAL
jgi:hypothetical protein